MDRQAIIDKLHAQLKEWNTEIDRLEAKAELASANAKEDYRQSIDTMKQRKVAAQQKLKELQGSSDEAWDEIKKGFDEAMDSIKRAYDSAKSKF